jgi:urease subunit gamma/beta
VALGGSRIVSGQAGFVEGPLDAPDALNRALEAARAKGYRGC